MRIVRLTLWSLIACVGVASAAWAQTSPRPQPVPTVKTSPKTAPQIYLDYRAAVEKAKTLDDILPFIAAAPRKDVDAAPVADRDLAFQAMKKNVVNGLKVVKEDRVAGGVKLTVSGVGADKKPMTGTVTLVRESGVWKIVAENW